MIRAVLAILLVLLYCGTALPQALETVKTVARDPTGEACRITVGAARENLRFSSNGGITVQDFMCSDTDGDGVGTWASTMISGDAAIDELTTATSPWYNVGNVTYGALASNDGTSASRRRRAAKKRNGGKAAEYPIERPPSP